VFPNLHEDASCVGSKPRVNCLELQPSVPLAGIPVTMMEILIPWDPSLLRGIRIVSADLCGTNEICGLPQDLGQRGLLLFQVWNQHRHFMEMLDKFGEGLLRPLLDFGQVDTSPPFLQTSDELANKFVSQVLETSDASC